MGGKTLLSVRDPPNAAPANSPTPVEVASYSFILSTDSSEHSIRYISIRFEKSIRFVKPGLPPEDPEAGEHF
jgi:hypothetical protein